MKYRFLQSVPVLMIVVIVSCNCLASSSPVQVSNKCFARRFTNSPVDVPAKIDILIVKDSSPATKALNSSIADSFGAFVQGLPATLDYRIAVTMSYSAGTVNGEKLLKTSGQ